MKEKFLQTFSINSKISKIFSKYTVFLVIIIGIALSIRLYFFPIDVPLNNDALYYFWYSSDIYQIGGLPKEWSPDNNGWPIFTSIFFIISDSKDIFVLMQIQRLLSVLASILVIIPTYFLCKKFVTRKLALIGVSFVAFDPRLMINSFLGVTDPIYLLLITTSLTLFLFSNKKIVYFSFALVALATIIRSEGLSFFVVLSIMFLIRYRKENYKVFFKYFLALGIFILIILPVIFYHIEVNGTDGIFMRNFISGDNLVSSVVGNDSRNSIIVGLELFIKYLVWVMIPNFIIFIPLGLFLIFQKRNFEKNIIILSLGIMSIPALYAYTSSSALDTRYLYTLFPMFSVLAVLSIEKVYDKLNKPNILVIIIIVGIIVSSIIFYDQQKIDYKHEKESFEIMKRVSSVVKGINVLYQESQYFNTIQTIEQWPNTHTEMGLGTKYDITTIPTKNFNSLEDYITESRNKGLTHIMVDNKKERQDFLVDVFDNESDYDYLEKIYDSKIDGFVYHVKVFKIDYKLFDSLKKIGF